MRMGSTTAHKDHWRSYRSFVSGSRGNNAKAPVFAHKWSLHCYARKLQGDDVGLETPKQDVAGLVASVKFQGFVSTFLVLSDGTRTTDDQLDSRHAC